MTKQRNTLLVLTLLVFFPVATNMPAADAQGEIMDFVMAYPEDIVSLNPLVRGDHRSRWYAMLVYDTLLSYNEDMDIMPWLAEDYDVSSDGLEVTFTLREGVAWHDGEPLTPEDVKFTFEYIRNGTGTVIGWAFMQHVTDVEITGRNIVVTLDEVFSFSADVLGSMRIVPKHIREGIAANHSTWQDHTNATSHIGSGMFKYVARTPGEFTTLDRSDDWWGNSTPSIGQLPNIERVRIDVVRTQDARIMAMRNGDADTERYEVFGAYVQTVLDAPELQLISGVPSLWEYVLGMNITLPGLDDFQVRKAIAYAINRQELINVGRLGYASTATSVIPDAFYPEHYHADGDFPSQNTTIANQILDDAGWVDTNLDGVRDNGAGVELSYDLWTQSMDDPSVATGAALKVQLEEIGFEINIVNLGNELVWNGIYVKPRTYEMFAMGIQFRPEPIHPWLRMHSENDFSWGANVYGLANDTLDSILEDFIAATPDEFPAMTRTVQIAATENMPYIPLYVSDDTHAIRAEWTNFSIKRGGPFTPWNPETIVFMYDTGTGAPYGYDLLLLFGVGAGALVAVVICSYYYARRK